MAQKINIQGPVACYTQPYSATSPVTANAVSWGAPWVKLGWKNIKDGLKFKHITKVDDFDDIEEFPGCVDADIISETATFTLKLKQTTIAALKNLLNGATYTSGTSGSAPNKISVGGSNTINFLSFGFQGTDENGKPLVMWASKVRPNDTLDIQFKKGNTEFEVEFTVYFDTSKAAGTQLWEIYELV